MAAPDADYRMGHETLWCDDETFEEKLGNLNMRGLLDLVSLLQAEMAEEQRQFDWLSAQLQDCYDSAQHKRVTAALCNSQMKLAMLCNRNMRCFTQQAICNEKEKWRTSNATSETTSIKTRTINSNFDISKETKARTGFRDSLRFFQKQEVKGRVPFPDTPINVINFNQTNGDHSFLNESKSSFARSSTVPSVDNILKNVRTICSNRNSTKTTPSTIKPVINSKEGVASTNGMNPLKNVQTVFSKVSSDTSNQSNSLSNRFNPSFDVDKNAESSIIFNPALKDNNLARLAGQELNSVHHNKLHTSENVLLKKSEPKTSSNVYPESEKVNLGKYLKSSLNGDRHTMSSVRTSNRKDESNVQNELFAVMEKMAAKRKEAEIRHSIISSEFSKLASKLGNNTRDTNVQSQNVTDHQKRICFMPVRPQPVLKQNSKPLKPCSQPEQKGQDVSIRNDKNCFKKYHENIINFINDGNLRKNNKLSPTNKIISEKSRAISNNSDFDNSISTKLVNDSDEKINNTKVPPESDNFNNDDIKSKIDLSCENKFRELAKLRNDNKPPDKKPGYPSENGIEKNYDSLESDYQPQDFVVHKTNFSQDYLDITSEDAFSSINEEYEVEQPDTDDGYGPDIPSPDYISDEDEEFLVHQGTLEYDDDDSNDFIDNSKQYINDPRRFYYYPDDKELEVIPEEDEDDLEDDLDHDSTSSQEYSDQGGNDMGDSGVADDDISEILFPGYHDKRDYVDGRLTKYWDPTTTVFPKLYNLPENTEITLARKEDIVFINLSMSIQLSRSLDKLDRLLDMASYFRTYDVKIVHGKIIFSRHGTPIASSYLPDSSCIFKEHTVFINDNRGNSYTFHFECPIECLKFYETVLPHAEMTYEESYLKPFLSTTSKEKIIVVDIGGQSIRAGILKDTFTLPQLYFPSICVKKGVRRLFGIESLQPKQRHGGEIEFVFQTNDLQFEWNAHVLFELLHYIFSKLEVIPTECQLMCVTSIPLGAARLHMAAKVILQKIGMKSFLIARQPIATMIAYDATSGIYIEVGERNIVRPFYEGTAPRIKENINHMGTQKVLEQLSMHLRHGGFNCRNQTMMPILLKYIFEGICYVSEDFPKDLQEARNDSSQVEKALCIVDCFKNSDGLNSEILLSSGRFISTEGLFTPEVWGNDIPSLKNRIIQAIMSVPEDCRLEVTSNIYLSGGLTLMEGFIERLRSELQTLQQSLKAEFFIHHSQNRLHMAYLGAQEIAALNKELFISQTDLDLYGVKCFDKWDNLM